MNKHAKSGQRNHLIRVLLLASGAAFGIAAEAPGQEVIQWANPAGGTWNVPQNWSPQIVPSTTSQIASVLLPGVYTVSLDAAPSILSLQIANTSATLVVPGTRSLSVTGGIANDGTIVISSDGAANTGLVRFSQTASLSGSGSVILNAHGGDITTARLYVPGPSVTITHGAGHTIRGCGRLAAPMVNNGTVLADSAVGMLDIYHYDMLNNSVLGAASPGILQLNSLTVTQPSGGLIQAGTGIVRFSGSTVVGGSLASDAGGYFQSVAGSSSTLSDLAVAGQVIVPALSTLQIGGAGITNNGTITVNSDGAANTALFRFSQSGSLEGVGAVVLSAHPGLLSSARLDAPAAGLTVAHGAGHTIRGCGRVAATIVNHGTILADSPSGTLEIVSYDLTNSHRLAAAASGVLRLGAITVSQNSGGIIDAGPGTVLLAGPVINGGGLTSGTGGVVQTVAGTNTTLSDVNVTASLVVPATSNLHASGAGITNNGTITVTSDGAANTALLRFDESGSLGGAGAVVLVAHPGLVSSARLDVGGSSVTITHEAAHTIRGCGRVAAPMLNHGTILADSASGPLEIVTYDVTNANRLAAAASGVLWLGGMTVTQPTGGAIDANDGTVRLAGVTIVGGAITAAPAGQFQAVAGTTSKLTDVASSAAVLVPATSTLALGGTGLTNTGTITVASDGAANTARVYFAQNGELRGSGSVLLVAHGGSLASARLETTSSDIITNAAGHTIRGLGQIAGNFVNHGRLAPESTGDVTGTLQVARSNGSFTQSASGVFDVEVGPAAKFDRVEVTATATLGGTLRVRLAGGYVPPPGSSFEVLAAGTRIGEFGTLDMPPHRDGQPSFQVSYTPVAVRVWISCPPDYDANGLLQPADVALMVSTWLTSLSAGTLAGDYDGSGAVEPADVALFVQRWFAAVIGGC